MPARVVHAIHSGGFYGAEKVVCDLLAEQAAAGGPAPCLLALLDPGRASNEVADRASSDGRAVIRLNADPGISLRSLRAYAAALREAGAGLVHSHGYKATTLHLLSRRAGLHGVPLLVTAHGYPKGSGTWKATLYRCMDILQLSFADCVAAVSGEMRTFLRRRNPMLRPRLITNGIPTDLRVAGTSPLRQRLLAEGDRPFHAEGHPAGEAAPEGRRVPVIGSAGRLIPMKNHAALIRAYARVRLEAPCRLVILGDGPLRGELEALWKALIPGEPVRLYPFQADVLEWMADMDVFCMPSRDGEGLPIALLEAGLLGRAALCTASGGIPELLRDGRNGRLVPLDDEDALRAALLDLIRDDGARAACGEALREDILRDHDIAATHARYLEAYAQALARTR
jgi:glycosyltransferase involved in cell wall biosynthesis